VGFFCPNLVHTLPTQSEDPVWEVEFGPDGETLVSTNGSELKLWNAEAGSLKESIDVTNISTVEFSPNNKVLAVGSHTTVKICRIESSSSCQSFAQAQYKINSLAFSPNGKLLVTASSTFADRAVGKGTVKVWNFNTGELITTLSRMETDPLINIGPNGEKIAVAGGKGRVRIWEISD
jgi:WD40 repeat protein